MKTLADKVRILDGGLASTLQQIGQNVEGNPLWSAYCLFSSSDSIYQVHKKFLDAGAEILITASYQASIDGFAQYLGLSRIDSLKLIGKSVNLAKNARQSFLQNNDKEIIIAGSIGPYGASKADGSEYSGNYVTAISKQALMDWHRPRMEALIKAGVDILAMETMPALPEAVALLTLLKDFPDTKAWVTFSCKNEHCTNYGDDFGKAVKACYDENPQQLIGIGVNCTNPLYITPLLIKAKESVPTTKLTRVIYPNSGEIWSSEKRWEGNPTSFSEIVDREWKTWASLGVRVIGGCCRVTPEHIATISHIIRNQS